MLRKVRIGVDDFVGCITSGAAVADFSQTTRAGDGREAWSGVASGIGGNQRQMSRSQGRMLS